MDFPFDVNALFPDRITVLDQNLTPSRRSVGRPEYQHQIATVIDELGKASAKAQQLAAPITSAAKLQMNRHHLYLLKDGESNGGRGVAVGFLKVGYKKLFLLDQRGAHVETEPLCVLDFYVAEKLQRHGYGLELFRWMLQHKRVDPVQMAYDRPSPKFLSFLEKHYGLKNSVPQVNNFVVFDGFFKNRSAVQLRKVPPRKPEGEIKPYSLTEREAVREEQKALPWPFTHHAAPPLSPPSAQSSAFSRSLSVGSSPSRVPPHPSLAPGPYRGQTPHSQLLESMNCRARRTSLQSLVAQGNLYSRDINNRSQCVLMEKQLSTLKLPGLQPVLRETEKDTVADTERHAAALGHTDTHRFARATRHPGAAAHGGRAGAGGAAHSVVAHSNGSRAPPPVPPLTFPPLPPSRMDPRHCKTPLAPRERERETESRKGGREVKKGQEEVWPSQRDSLLGNAQVQEVNLAGSRGAWSWTVGEEPWNAQWVRRKQEYRSTRPW
ncbi:alpha-tubulin N-acetyltransferase 1 isoform X1 [Arapaima gigas]